MLLMATVGGCFTITVCIGEVNEPQSSVAVNDKLYVPGLLNWKTGLIEVFVPLKYVIDEVVPQKPLV